MKHYLMVLLCIACSINAKGESKKARFIREQVEFATQQLDAQAKLDPEKDGYPRTTRDGKLHFTHRKDWTEGFFPGSLWYLYEQNPTQAALDAALKWTLPLESLQHMTWNHDVGFMIYCSYGNALRFTHNKAYEPIIIQAAKSLVTRYDETVGLTKSWNYRESWDGLHKWHYPVIIDNMMNLELLYAATKLSGDESFARIATSHARKTMEHQIRPDYSTYHVVNYDPNTGAPLFKGTCQGYADESTWARGQAWAIYGFTMVYRETKEPAFLACAERLADYWLDHPQMPKDLIPYWDFEVKTAMKPADWSLKREYDKENPPRDASAAAIVCAALFELSELSSQQKKWFKAAEKTLKSLASPAYKAQLGSNAGFLLKHSTGSLPHGAEIDVPLVYADYYFLEALSRYHALTK